MATKRRVCRDCGRRLGPEEQGACVGCRGVAANIKAAHAPRLTAEEAGDPARYEELLRKRVGT